MDTEDLSSLWGEYRSYNGTCNDSANKREVSINNFEAVLTIAMSLASELKELKKEPKKENDTSYKISLEDAFLDHCDDDGPDEAKQAADFARYG